jgi:hypothetical protein
MDSIITAGGRNTSPRNIENSLKGSCLIEQVAIIGDRRKFLPALVIPNFEESKKRAERNNIACSDNKTLVARKEVVDLYRKEPDEHTKKFSRVDQIRTFTIVEAEWTQATGDLTPTLEVKRRVIEQKYGALIDDMYADAKEQPPSVGRASPYRPALARHHPVHRHTVLVGVIDAEHGAGFHQVGPGAHEGEELRADDAARVVRAVGPAVPALRADREHRDRRIDEPEGLGVHLLDRRPVHRVDPDAQLAVRGI